MAERELAPPVVVELVGLERGCAAGRRRRSPIRRASSTARVISHQLLLGGAGVRAAAHAGLLRCGGERVDELIRQLAMKPSSRSAGRCGPAGVACAWSGRACGRAGRPRRPRSRSCSGASTFRRSCTRPTRPTGSRRRASARCGPSSSSASSSRRRSAGDAVARGPRRRSVSICDSPGPSCADASDAAARATLDASTRPHAAMYSSWASSTCRLPSASWAWPAKMSRITAVRSGAGRSVAARTRGCAAGAGSARRR